MQVDPQIAWSGAELTKFIMLSPLIRLPLALALILGLSFAIGHASPGAYNIVDDDPAPARDWLPVYAQALGAKPPRKVPVFLARWLGGEYGVRMMTRTEGASNRKARDELGLQLRYPSWRRGFAEALG